MGPHALSRGGAVEHGAMIASCRNACCARDNHAMSQAPPHSSRSSAANSPGLSDAELEELQSLLDSVPAPLEPLDVSMLDGFLCGLLVQPRKVQPAQWLLHITDADGRPLPPGFDATRLHALALRRHAELNDAIGRRQWFDPWVFETNGLSDATEEDDEDQDLPLPDADDVYPWVAGFATAMELFPQLMEGASPALTEPLALLYRHLDPDDLEDADDLLAEIESLEPPADLSEAVEGLVRATLLLADIGRPVPQHPTQPGARPHPPVAGRTAARRHTPRRH